MPRGHVVTGVTRAVANGSPRRAFDGTDADRMADPSSMVCAIASFGTPLCEPGHMAPHADLPAPSGGRPRNARGEGGKLHTEILDAMLRLIANEERMRPIPLSLREVAKEANITAPAIYRHFPDKETLGRAAMHTLFERLLAAMDRADEEAADLPPTERFAAIAHGYCRFAQDNPVAFRLIFSVPPEALNTEGPDTADVAARWKTAVTRLAKQGLRMTQTPEEAALSLWSAVHGRLMLDMSLRDVWSPHGGVHEFIDELTRSATARAVATPEREDAGRT